MQKNANKNLTNTETLSTSDNFTSTCLEHPLTKITQAQTGKAPWKPAKKKKKKKNRKGRKKVIVKRLEIGATTAITEVIRIKRMFMFLTRVWLKN